MKKYLGLFIVVFVLSIIYLAFNFEDSKAKSNLDDPPYQVCVIDEAGNPVIDAHVILCDGTNIYDLGNTQDIGCVANYYSGTFCVDVTCSWGSGATYFTFVTTGTGAVVTVTTNGTRCANCYGS